MKYTLSITFDSMGETKGYQGSVEVPEDADDNRKAAAVEVALRGLHGSFSDLLGIPKPRVMLRSQR